jgi:type III restriction enzyme
MTATPQVEKGAKKQEPFKNVIYSYPLSSALKDGFVKEPAVATRENFDASNYTKESLELLKLHDGMLIHEETKTQLKLYSLENNTKFVKPFVLVVAEDTKHASELKALIESENFLDGDYNGKAIEVHSQQKGDEKDENVQLLLNVEDPHNPTEVVIHVNMLKEGWDVTNLYTIIPLRAANSKTLVEQSIGRGLRLPYGKRTGVPAVDRLTIVSHDRFQEIIDAANSPDSIIRAGVVIGKDIPAERSKVVIVAPKIVEHLAGSPTADKPEQGTLFKEPQEQKIALATLEAIKEFEQLPRSADLTKPEIMKELVARVTERLKPTEARLFVETEPEKIAEVIAKTVEYRNDMSIDIPRIIVAPKGEVEAGFRAFDLDVAGIHLQPVSQEILIAHLHDQTRHTLHSGHAVVTENRPEDYLVRGLIEFDDIHYDTHAELLYKLSGQLVKHLRSYLIPDDVLNVLQAHNETLVNTIHAQMQAHYEEKATEYEVRVSRGFQTLRPNNYAMAAHEQARNFRLPVDEKMLIRGMLFSGFKKCLYSVQKFDSDSERRFSVILENDGDVLKWFKPAKGDFQIHYSQDAEYEPDFVVETKTARYLCEP